MPIPYHMQDENPTRGAEGTTKCIRCKCLIWEAESIWGYGLRCGCLKWVMLKMKAKLKEVGFDVREILDK